MTNAMAAPLPAQAALEADGLVLALPGRLVLDGVSLALRPGRLTVVVGPNGAGKTSLVDLLAGIRTPDAGRITIAGRPLASYSPRQLARIRAVVRQRPPLPEGFLVAELVATGSGGVVDERVAAALERVGMAPYAERRVETLSGGELQLVDLARALVRATPILFLDEPTASLDPAHQHAVMTIARERVEDGATVLSVLHDLTLAARYADELVVLAGGRIVAHGAPDEVLSEQLLAQVWHYPLEVVRRGERIFIG